MYLVREQCLYYGHLWDWPQYGHQNIDVMFTNGLIRTSITGRNTGYGRSSGVTVASCYTVQYKNRPFSNTVVVEALSLSGHLLYVFVV